MSHVGICCCNYNVASNQHVWRGGAVFFTKMSNCYRQDADGCSSGVAIKIQYLTFIHCVLYSCILDYLELFSVHVDVRGL